MQRAAEAALQTSRTPRPQPRWSGPQLTRFLKSAVTSRLNTARLRKPVESSWLLWDRWLLPKVSRASLYCSSFSTWAVQGDTGEGHGVTLQHPVPAAVTSQGAHQHPLPSLPLPRVIHFLFYILRWFWEPYHVVKLSVIKQPPTSPQSGQQPLPPMASSLLRRGPALAVAGGSTDPGDLGIVSGSRTH